MKRVGTMGTGAPRRGLVLGGGGVLGAAWMIGALSALEESTGIDARSYDYILGTSAGSVVGALLGAGIGVRTQRDHQLGRTIDGPLAGREWSYDTLTGRALPPRPHLGVGSPALVRRNVRRLRRMPPMAVLSAFVPEGRGTLDGVGTLIEAVVPPGRWPSRDGVWVVAMDYETGRRVPFGRDGELAVGLSDAVRASCAIPGWFAPVVLGEHRFVDGGTCSATSVDLLAGLGLDEVHVVAPMVSFELDHPRSLISRLERRWRARVTRRCLREAAKLRAQGTQVSILGPGPDDLEVMGANIMDVSRRLAVLETSLRTSARVLAGTPRLADAG